MKQFAINNKIFLIISLSLISLFFSNFLSAQISSEGIPLSYSVKLKKSIHFELMEIGDVNKLLLEDTVNNKLKGKPLHFAKNLNVNFTPDNSGVWDTLPDGNKIWRLGIKSTGAYSIGITFNKYNLPSNSSVFVYNINKTQLLGAYTSKNNKNSRVLSISPVKGDAIIIEYNEPKKVAFKPLLSINQVAHDYKGIFEYLKIKDGQYGLSGDCNIDINCNEGQEWQNEKHSVCRIIINNTELCTGALINNTQNDGKPYLLTANHCIGSENLAEKSIFYFNYEKKSCDDTIDPNPNTGSIQSLSGSSLKATKNDSSGKLDFSLVELSSMPPKDYKPYFSGWYNASNPAMKTVCIHHPLGDVKKISKDNDSPIIDTYTGYDSNSHWQILSWELGTTEGGSSGSPLFNENHNIIGNLTGGDASCDYPFNDFFARLSNSWDDYSDYSQQLKHWLDPNNSGVTSLNGYKPNFDDPTDIITLSNFNEGDTATLYIADEGGYLSGNNAFGDLAKAEYYNSSSYGFHNVIKGVYVYFAVAKGSKSNISFPIWNDNNGSPYKIIATATKSISSIVTDVIANQITYVEFANPVDITGSFYAGVVLPQEAGDTLAIVTNTEYNAQVNTAWEKNAQEQWLPYNSDDSWGISLNQAIWPVVGYVTSINNITKVIPDVNVYPNPSSDNVFVDLSNIKMNADIFVFNSFGVLIKKFDKEKTNSNVVKINFSEYPAGLYLIQIITDNNKIVKKVLIVK
ncbi:MAG: T9SS type A sorting domain-containing protein [Bacteroidetes bacterium]|nr:T9SS type A sorting domain-containing protein [Bacteroidota bacterium]